MVEVIENAKPEDWQEGDIINITLEMEIINGMPCFRNSETDGKRFSYFLPKSAFAAIKKNNIRRLTEADKIRAEIERLQARLVEIEPETENAPLPQHVFDAAKGFGQYFKSQLPPPPEGFGEWILHDGNGYPLEGSPKNFEGFVLCKNGQIFFGRDLIWRADASNPIIAYALPLNQNGGGA